MAAGGRETFVFVKDVGRPPEEDPHRMLIGHAGNITCLAFSEDGTKIVSGGWDSQVFVWDVEEGNVVAELVGHEGPVWGVMVYDAKLVLTACADKMIRLYDLNGKMLKGIKGHTDVVRCFCKLPSGHPSGGAFASAGNDEVIRLWTLDGRQVGSLEGHTAYIYDLAILPNGDIVSSSEDRTVRIWRDGQCIQTITHPAISIWTVNACEETGDIVSGASDNIIRIFSRHQERQADPEVSTYSLAVMMEYPTVHFLRRNIGRESFISTQNPIFAADPPFGRFQAILLTGSFRLLHPLKKAIACMRYRRRLRHKVNPSRKRTCQALVRIFAISFSVLEPHVCFALICATLSYARNCCSLLNGSIPLCGAWQEPRYYRNTR